MNAPIVVVTGANRGIGFEICRQLSERDVHVVLTSRDTSTGQAAARRLLSAHHPVRFAPVDVTSDGSASALHAFVLAEFGRCDVLINNAGIIAKTDDSIVSVTPGAVEQTLATNTVGPLRITQAMLPLLRTSRTGGRVINVSSGAGELTDWNPTWSPAYSLSKAALNLTTRMLATAFAPDGIAVNAMCPGWVRTDMGGAEADRDVSEGADTAVWLALDAPQSLTGKFVRDRKVIPW